MSFSNIRLGQPKKHSRKRRAPGAKGLRAFLGDVSKIPSLEEIADVGNLLEQFHFSKANAGQATGIDRVSFKNVGNSEAATFCRTLNKCILGGGYRPQPERPVDIPRENKSPRRLHIGCIFDRVVAAAVAQGISPFFEARVFADCSYAYRTGRSALTMLAKMKLLAERSGLWVVGNHDVASAFPSTDLNGVMAAFAEYIKDSRLLRLIGDILHGAEGNRKVLGLSQGNPLAPIAFNLFLHEILDWYYLQGHTEPHWFFRYSDNLVTLSLCAPESRRARARLEEIFAPHGYRLKTESPEGERIHADLRAGETTQLLGFVLSQHEGELDFDVGPDRWAHLESNLQECHTHANPYHRAVQTLSGWVTSAAPALTPRRFDAITSRIMEITRAYDLREVREKSVRSQMTYAHGQWVYSLSATPSGVP